MRFIILSSCGQAFFVFRLMGSLQHGLLFCALDDIFSSFLQGVLHFRFSLLRSLPIGFALQHTRFWKYTNRFFYFSVLKLSPFWRFIFFILHMPYRSARRMCLYYMCFLFFSSPSLCNFWTNGMMSAFLLAISMLAPGSLGKRPFLRWLMLNIETLHAFYEIAVEHQDARSF